MAFSEGPSVQLVNVLWYPFEPAINAFAGSGISGRGLSQQSVRWGPAIGEKACSTRELERIR